MEDNCCREEIGLAPILISAASKWVVRPGLGPLIDRTSENCPPARLKRLRLLAQWLWALTKKCLKNSAEISVPIWFSWDFLLSFFSRSHR